MTIDSSSPLASLLESARQVAIDANSVLVKSDKGPESGSTSNDNTQSRIDEWIEINASEYVSEEKEDARPASSNNPTETAAASSSIVITRMTPTHSTIDEQSEAGQGNQSDDYDDFATKNV